MKPTVPCEVQYVLPFTKRIEKGQLLQPFAIYEKKEINLIGFLKVTKQHCLAFFHLFQIYLLRLFKSPHRPRNLNP